MAKKKKTAVAVPADDGEAFVRSLDEFDASDGETVKKKAKHKCFNILSIAFIAICAAVLVVCLILIFNNLSDKERGEEVYDEAASIFIPPSAANASGTQGDARVPTPYEMISGIYRGEDPSSSAASADLSSVRASLSSLKEKNPDVVGWISVEGTKINYPLMRSSNGNDDYYLTHAYNGEYLAVGSIYMVSECDVKLDNNYNTLIYGHNVVNGAMFHDVMKFLDPEFFRTKIYIYTLDGIYVYQPFSIYRTQSDYNYIQTYFGSESEFLRFAAEMKSNSEIPSDLSIESGDTMITLSTCTGTGVVSNARYSLHAKLVEFID
ncbi:MAG: class B sortase [Clostridia bacterium]|nr:class B sortase [Clostridia bacterium]